MGVPAMGDMRLDLNADLGEGYGAWRLGDDLALLPLLSSANIACGYHAGDAEIMAQTVAAARRSSTDIGAHIGLPDLIGFGRRRMDIDGARFASHVLYQLGALHAIARAASCRVTHASFHGALGDMASEDENLAMPLVGAIAAFDPRIVISTSPGTMIMRAAQRHGLASIGIFCADRSYRADGKLVSRSHPDAVLRDPAEVARRIRVFLTEGTVETVDGGAIPMPAGTAMIHGDTPNAAAIASAIRQAVDEVGGKIVPISQLASQEETDNSDV